jgi:hypothetical protein
MMDHVFRDGCLGHIDAQFQQFAVNPRCSQKRVISTYGSDQIASLELAVVLFGRDEPSKSNTSGSLVGARR